MLFSFWKLDGWGHFVVAFFAALAMGVASEAMLAVRARRRRPGGVMTALRSRAMCRWCKRAQAPRAAQAHATRAARGGGLPGTRQGQPVGVRGFLTFLSRPAGRA